MFATEKEMQKSFEEHLRSIFHDNEAIIASQVEGLFGVPDVVLLEPPSGRTAHIIAMELKLSSWKKALTQAFRYKSFAWEAYVVLDASRSNSAINNIAEFREKNIGLATYSVERSFVVHCRPRIERPYCIHLTEKLVALFDQEVAVSNIKRKRPSRIDGFGKVFTESIAKQISKYPSISN